MDLIELIFGPEFRTLTEGSFQQPSVIWCAIIGTVFVLIFIVFIKYAIELHDYPARESARRDADEKFNQKLSILKKKLLNNLPNIIIIILTIFILKIIF